MLQTRLVTYTGTTAAQNVQMGFRPQAFLGFNWTDGTIAFFWHRLDLTKVFKMIGTGAFTTPACVITQIDHGLALPASNTDVNSNTKVYYGLAFIDRQ